MACSSGDGTTTTVTTPDSGPLAWTPQLTASQVPAATVAGTAYSSSTQLSLQWAVPTNVTPARYEITWTDVVSGRAAGAASTGAGATIAHLRAATSYRIEVKACTASTCYASPLATLTAQTPTEAWQLQGSGASITGLTRIVADGNVRLHALRYGSDAPAALAGRVLLYYGPSGTSARGLSVAVTPGVASVSSPASYLGFTSLTGTAGLLTPEAPTPLVGQIATAQGVALSAAMGGRIRLYFESPGSDGRTRILSLDSQDGYAGLDFNPGAAGLCASRADYLGPCAPTVVIGVEGDATGANARIMNARQFKVGVATQDDWRWDGAAGSFMVFTVDAIAGCTTATHNQAYAVWSGSAWQVQYDAAGCPKLMKSMQAAHPLQQGGVFYKLYYGDPSDTTGQRAGSTLPFVGPKKLIYADGNISGDAARVDFEDWESVARGRNLLFLWPDGSTLDATAEGYIDDFTVLTPTGALTLQVMYLAITDGIVPPFSAAAVLLNP